jgi:predicted nucleic acid-binding protein
LRRYVRSASISAERAAEALADFLDLPLTRYPPFVLLPRVWQMPHNLTAYAAYLALAEALHAPLLTRDHTLARTHTRLKREKKKPKR